MADDHEVGTFQRLQRSAEHGQRQIADGAVGGADEQDVDDSVYQQSGADDPIMAAQASRLQIEYDRPRRPRQCRLTLARTVGHRNH